MKQYECTYMYGDVVYARGRGTSKRKAKRLAVRECLAKLWQERIDQETLLPQDLENLQPLEQPVAVATSSLSTPDLNAEVAVVPLSTFRPCMMHSLQRSQHVSQMLNVLSNKYPIVTRFEFDQKIRSMTESLWYCYAYLNEEKVFVGYGTGKKDSRTAALHKMIPYLLSDNEHPEHALPASTSKETLDKMVDKSRLEPKKTD